MAISKAKEAGAEAVICAIPAILRPCRPTPDAGECELSVLIPEGYVALGKVAEALLYGAEVISDWRKFRLSFRNCPRNGCQLSGDIGQLRQSLPLGRS